MRIVAIYFAFPFWLTLKLLRPWQKEMGIRKFAKWCVGPFFWVNNLWVTAPLLLVQYLIWGKLTWLGAIASFGVVAMVLHSAIAHSTDSALRQWEESAKAPG